MLLTVFTPTYNRAHTLERLYNSLRCQTCKEFCWLVVDDGSTDNTKEKIENWTNVSDNGFEVEYIYKENGGLHTGYNCAIEHMKSELAVCIDSDDFMPVNAVQLIKEKWERDGSSQYAGIIGLDFDMKGQVIGDLLPEQKTINLIDLAIGKYKIVNGDRKNVVRTDLYKAVAPMKVFKGEKNFNPHYMHLLISKQYDFLVLNKELCTVEYQPGGMTASILWQYYNSPNSFLEIRKLHLSFEQAPPKYIVSNMIHLVSSALLSGHYTRELKETDKKGLMLLCTLPGVLLMMLTMSKGKKR